MNRLFVVITFTKIFGRRSLGKNWFVYRRVVMKAIHMQLKSSSGSSDMVVGHVPRKISACSRFLEQGGTIRCIITGSRRSSTDLRQGGLDVPCKYTFIGENPHLSNVARLVNRFSMPKKRRIDGNRAARKKKFNVC